MTENEQMFKEFINAFDDGEIDISKVPTLNLIISREVTRQVSQAVNPAQVKAQASQQLKNDQVNYANQVNGILQKQQARLQQQAQQINVDEVKRQLMAEIDRQRKSVEEAQAKLDHGRERLAEREKKQFWRELMPFLAGVLVCLFLAVMILLLFKALIWDGIWHGLGLNKVAGFVLTLAKTHPFGGSVLGLIILIAIVAVTCFSFAMMVKAVQALADWDAEKLMFWRNDRY